MDQSAGPGLTGLELPQEVLETIFLHLQPKSFLQLCSITKQFWQGQHRNPTYWRVKTSTTFRVPISPLLHAEGNRWYWLFKKLRTQTKAFVWGQGRHDALGLPSTFVNHKPKGIWGGTAQIERVPDRSNRAWPSKMEVPDEVGIIADLQCGGWSTTMLSSQGSLFSVGIFNDNDGRQPGRRFDRLTRLQYPSSSPIESFSAGRSHVLAVDEAGHVWTWNRIDLPGRRVHDSSPIKASRVVAGWSVGSAYTGEGISYWQVPRAAADGGVDAAAPGDLDGFQATSEPEDPIDTFIRTTVVPGTSFRDKDAQKVEHASVGEVLGYIVLEAYIVFITTKAKALACRIVKPEDPKELAFEIPGFSAPHRELKDIHGAFRSFSVFTAMGEVLSGDQNYLDRLYIGRRVSLSPTEQEICPLGPEAAHIPRPDDIAALQRTGVISIAYGDYHFHALRSNGQILSYGREPGHCGALGLGGRESGLRFRGVKFDHGPFLGDANAMPIVYKKGRQIWFSKSQKEWLKSLEDAVSKPTAGTAEQHALVSFLQDEYGQAAYSEWVEQEGRAWEDGVTGEDSLPSYFATSVAAAGWHSAALVLENAGLVDKVNRKWTDRGGKYIWEDEGFPKIRLPNGSEIPGRGSLREWRGEMPAQTDFAE